MSFHSAVPAQLYSLGDQAYQGNSFLRPFFTSFYPSLAAVASTVEGGVDTNVTTNIILASGSTTADYNPATFFDVDSPLTPYDLTRNAPPWASSHSFYPPIV